MYEYGIGVLERSGQCGCGVPCRESTNVVVLDLVPGRRVFTLHSSGIRNYFENKGISIRIFPGIISILRRANHKGQMSAVSSHSSLLEIESFFYSF